jgi:hypothetical protein
MAFKVQTRGITQKKAYDRSKEADSRILLTNPPSNPILHHTQDQPENMCSKKFAASFKNIKKYINMCILLGINVEYILLQQAVGVTAAVL